MPAKQIILPSKIDLNEFISVQAHDLRTPFNHIIGFSKMTLNTVGDAPLTDLQKEDLGTIYRSGLRALSYMNGLIDIARLNRGEKELSFSDVDIPQLVEQSLGLWKKFNPGGNVQVESRLHVTSATIRSDEQILKQVMSGFTAFVANYCEAQAKLLISVDEESERFVFTFSSAGVKARQPSILDLEIIGYVNRTFVEMHAGEFLIAEENDEGAIIQFTLPKI